MTSPVAPKIDQPAPEAPPAQQVPDAVKKRVQKMRKTSQTLTPEQIKKLIEISGKQPEPPK